MAQLVYAGIGSRATPRAVLDSMTVMAAWLARRGWHLHSGGAAGADSAFAAVAPAGARTLFLPWPGYGGNAGPDCRTLGADRYRRCLAIAADLHPAWHRCSPAARRLHARNTAILLGQDTDAPGRRRDLLDSGRTAERRHRHGHPHRAPIAAFPVLNLGAMHPPRGVRAAGGDPRSGIPPHPSRLIRPRRLPSPRPPRQPTPPARPLRSGVRARSRGSDGGASCRRGRAWRTSRT